MSAWTVGAWRGVAIAAAALAMLAAAPAAGPQEATAQGFGARQPLVRVEWKAGPLRGRAGIWGHVVNESGTAIGNVFLLVETLDVTGQPVARQHVRLFGEVDTVGRVYFETAVSTPGADYRVEVESYATIRGGD